VAFDPLPDSRTSKGEGRIPIGIQARSPSPKGYRRGGNPNRTLLNSCENPTFQQPLKLLIIKGKEIKRKEGGKFMPVASRNQVWNF